MLKAFRILLGSLLAWLHLHAANLAVRDCTVGVDRYDNCLWTSVRGRLGLPPSLLGRAVTLELVGLALLAGLYLTIRYVFPFWKHGRWGGKEPGAFPTPDSAPTEKS
jgi:hypothetical protein